MPAGDWGSTGREKLTGSTTFGAPALASRALADGTEDGVKSPNRGGRWRLRNWRLRRKLVIVLAVPLLATLGFAGLRVHDEVQAVQRYGIALDEVALSEQALKVIDAVQAERDAALFFVANGKRAGAVDYGKRSNETDTAARRFAALVRDNTEVTDRVRAAVRSAVGALDRLPVLRSSVQSTQFPDISTADQYSALVNDLLPISLAVAAESAETGRTPQALSLFANAKEQIAQQNSFLLLAALSKRPPPVVIDRLRAAQAGYQAAIDQFTGVATADQRQRFQDVVSGGAVDDRARLAHLAVVQVDNKAPVMIPPGNVQRVGSQTIDRYRQFVEGVEGELNTDLRSLRNQTRQATYVNIGIAGAVLVGALLIMLVVARSLLKPLRTLRSSALDVAYRRLPDEVDQILADPNPMQASREVVRPVLVFGKEETGEVARAFDEVHARAVELAAEQALLRESVNSMFVNLSRRSQALVERQLSLIDRLEADEQDPDQLSSLFELDHLATRMRRNSENLLVLSGTDLGRRLNKAIPLSDVIGAAVSEIEQYARVKVSKAPAYLVAGSAVNDLVHLIAELLDNATVFSNPNTEVTVRSARRRTGELAIEVADRGVGIPDDELVAINERLSDPPELDVSVSRRMGLYVVGRLANRHEIAVVLRENQDLDGGVVARVVIPQMLVRKEEGRRPADTSGSFPAITGTDFYTSGTGSFPPVSSEADEGVSPAMASKGITGAFGISRSNNGGHGHDQPSQDFEAEQSVELGSSNGKESHPAEDEPDDAIDGADQDCPPNNDLHGAGRLDEVFQDSGNFQDSDDAESVQPVEAPAEAAYRPRAADEMDVPTDRLPIYEEVLSQWFSTDPDRPAARDRFASEFRSPALSGAGVSETAAGDEEVPEVVATEFTEPAAPPMSASGLPKRVPGATARERSAPRRQEYVEPQATGGAEWETPADSGWQAAEALLQPVDEMTAAGLPKRRPRAHLVPGSAEQRPGGDTGASEPASAAGPAPGLVPRSADAVRGRMSSLQQGVRRGRHALIEAHHDDAPATGASDAGHDSYHSEPRHHEEQE